MTTSQMQALCLGVLASGGGTNLQAIMDRCTSGELPARVGVVISNNSGSGALARARKAGIPAFHRSGRTHPVPEALDREIADILQAHGVPKSSHRRLRTQSHLLCHRLLL